MNEVAERISSPTQIMLTYAAAANAALDRALAERPEVLVYGEDVALPGGVFGVTKSLRKKYGERVFDTPISESAIIGSAIGAALFGARPVIEIMWADFLLVGLDQLVNQAANVRYLARGSASAPITVRTQQGTQPGACAQHSQSLEALLAHIPGLLVCMPATPQDAYDLLLTAIAAEDPVIVIENRNLYFAQKQQVEVGGSINPVGGAKVVRPGDDVTIVSWGATVALCVEAAAALASEGISAEVVDARWIAPFDNVATDRSVRRTGRLLVVHEANLTGGYGAEVVAGVCERGIPMRSAPARIGMPDVRVPAAPTLLRELVPSVERICERARGMCEPASYT